MFLRAVELQSWDCRCVVADFPVIFMLSIIVIRLRHITESCQSFQTVLFSGLRNILLQILPIVG